MKKDLAFVLNGAEETLCVEAHWRLIDLLRDAMQMTGTKEGCGKGECGACTVLMNGRAVNACLIPAFEVEGSRIETIEGLVAHGNQLSIIQQAFVDHGAIQCGFCSPGVIMSTKALLDEKPDPTEEEIRNALLGNLCRCTGYVQIVEAVKQVAASLKEQPDA